MNREQYEAYRQQLHQVLHMVKSLRDFGIPTMNAEIEISKLQTQVSKKYQEIKYKQNQPKIKDESEQV
jgi:hypothetical protein